MILIEKKKCHQNEITKMVRDETCLFDPTINEIKLKKIFSNFFIKENND